jgi:hypothetical protein
MGIPKNGKFNTILIAIMMVTILLCISSQVKAAQDGDYTYSIIEGKAQINGYTGPGGDITIPSSLRGFPVTSIGDLAFQSCTGLTGIDIPQGVTSIGVAAFNGCTNLANISIPQGVLSIGEQAFGICTSLTDVYIPQGVEIISSRAFISCTGLTSINIPESVQSIGSSTFNNCTALTTITVDVGNLFYQSIDGVLYNKAGNTLIMCPGGLTTIRIPEGVENIGRGAFFGCAAISSITIPQGVASIETEAFAYCTGLIRITFNSKTTTIYDSETTIPAITKIIGYDSSTAKDYAERYCREFGIIAPEKTLKSIAITTPADKLTYFVGESLDLTGLVVTGIYSDYSVKTETITTVNISGFHSSRPIANQVLTITVGDKTTTYAIKIAAPIFTYTILDGQVQITRYIGSDTNVVIPSTLGGITVTSIGEEAFIRCWSLTGIIMPSGLTSIGEHAFDGCSSLTSIAIPAGVISIGDYAFASCKGLTSIVIPSAVTSIGKGAFNGCTSLINVSVALDNLYYTSIDGVLYNKAGTILEACPGGKTSVSIPADVTSIAASSFSGCTSLSRN